MSDSISLSPINAFRRGTDTKSTLRMDSFDVTSTFAEIFELAKVPIAPRREPAKSDDPAKLSEPVKAEKSNNDTSDAASESEPESDAAPIATEVANAAQIVDVEQVAIQQETSEFEVEPESAASNPIATSQDGGTTDSKAGEEAASLPENQEKLGSNAEDDALLVANQASVSKNVEQAASVKETGKRDLSPQPVEASPVADVLQQSSRLSTEAEASVPLPADLDEQESLLPQPALVAEEGEEPRSRRRRGNDKRDVQIPNELPSTTAATGKSRDQVVASDRIVAPSNEGLPAEGTATQTTAAETKPLVSQVSNTNAVAPSANATAGINAAKPATSQTQPLQPAGADAAPSVGAAKVSGDSKPAATAKSQTAEASKLDLADRARLLQRVAKAFQQLGADGGSVKIRLHPPRLGSVGIDVSVSGKKLSARIVTETETAMHVLREHLPELRSRLAEQGFQLEQVDINTDHGNASQHGSHDQSSSSFRDVVGQPKRNAAEASSAEERARDSRTSVDSTTAGLDLVA